MTAGRPLHALTNGSRVATTERFALTVRDWEIRGPNHSWISSQANSILIPYGYIQMSVLFNLKHPEGPVLRWYATGLVAKASVSILKGSFIYYAWSL